MKPSFRGQVAAYIKKSAIGSGLRLLYKRSEVARKEVHKLANNVIRKKVATYLNSKGPLCSDFSRTALKEFDWEKTHENLKEQMPRFYATVVSALTSAKESDN